MKHDSYEVIESSLLDLALTYLQTRRKNVTAYNLLNTCHRILCWSELKGKAISDGKKIIFTKDGKTLVQKKYMSRFFSQKTM
jgi:hypothetical protein